MKSQLSKGTGIFKSKLKSKSKSNTLPSWIDGTTKNRIVHFIESVTNESSDDYIEIENRVAVFDNDGTLWTEYPYYTQFQFIIDRIKDLSIQHPEWNEEEPFKSILEGNINTVIEGGLHSIEKLIMVTHAGMTSYEFEKTVRNWINSANHPILNKPYKECIYLPMYELLVYLRSKKFKTYIVSGGGVEFIRPWAEETYGIPPEQVIGSSIISKYEIRNGRPELIRLPEINFINDHEGKPVGIYQKIGKKPVAAFGNSDGDFQMLEWVTSTKELSLGVLLHHDDNKREFAYDKNAFAGKLDKGLTEADKNGWVVVSMKDDWKNIFL